MSKVAVVYHSYAGITEKLVQALKQGVEKAGGECELFKASEAAPQDILEADTVVLASGQPFGGIAGPLKTFIEHCWNYENKDKLEGKKFATIINGNQDPKDSSDYLNGILPYFKLEQAADGLTCLAENAEEAAGSSEKLGEKLA